MASHVYSQQHYEDACQIWFSPDGERAARELNEMTVDEREKVWADLSGRESTTNFRREVVEDTKVIEEKLQELDNELLAIKQQQSKSSKAFDHAQMIAPEYTNNRAFRLMFLRSAVFDAQTAAASMVRHFETKLDLFGEETLGRKLLLSDLEEDDLDVFNTGVAQLVPTADVGGRKIVVDRPTVMKYKTRKNFCRVLWFTRMLLCEDEGVQKLGVVNIVDLLDGYKAGFDLELIRICHQLLLSLPWRVSAHYVLHRDTAWKQVIELERHFMSRSLRLRSRAISGSYQKCMYSLMCVGVPCEALPVHRGDGCKTPEYHQQWLEERRKLESEWIRQATYIDERKKRHSDTEVDDSQAPTLQSLPNSSARHEG